MTEAAAKKDTQKLQRAIVDGLEDVKAQDIRVFNTEHLSPLFERVIVASGTSNRQTKALASSVRDAVRDAGFPKPRIEGEENGEWIIVDCGAAVAHIMQPAIRQYYHLEEIWGDKPIRLKVGAPVPAGAPGTREAAAKAAAKKAPAKKVPAKGGSAGKSAAKSAGKPAGKTAGKAAPAKSAKVAGKTAAKKPLAPSTAKSAAKSSGKPAPARKTAAPAAKRPRPKA